MSDYNPRLPRLILIIILLVFATFLWMLCGCTSQKQITRTAVTVDSTAVREKQDSIRLLRTEQTRLEAEIRELQYAGVLFDTVYVPGRIDKVTNTVTIRPDGTIDASGKIKAAYLSRDTYMKLTRAQQRTIDSLAGALETEKKNVKTTEKVVTRDVARMVFPWWLAIIAALGWGLSAYLRYMRKPL